MAKRVRHLVQIVPHLENRYGADMAQRIMCRALARYDELLDENADEPKAYHMHTRERIYPAIACFDAMIAEGSTVRRRPISSRTTTSGVRVAWHAW